MSSSYAIRRALAGTAIFLLGCAHAPAPAPTPAVPPPPPPVSVSGLVVNGVTSKPLAGAHVVLEGIGEATSAEDGRFRIEKVPIGVAMLHVTVEGFRDNYQNVRVIPPEKIDAHEPTLENNWFVLMFQPSPYFDAFPPAAGARRCRTEAECDQGQVCFKTNFKEADMPACASPQPCKTERECKVGQRCEPVDLISGTQLRICQGQPAPEFENPEAAAAPPAESAPAPAIEPAATATPTAPAAKPEKTGKKQPRP